MNEPRDFGRSHVLHPWNPISFFPLCEHNDQEEEESLCRDTKRRLKYTDSSVAFSVLLTDFNLEMLLKGNLARISVSIASGR